jgi:hypothetical protein
MRFSTSILALAAVPFAAYAAPVRSRAAIDVTVLKFADVLEQLETQFYSTALSKFTDADFTSAGFTSSAAAIQQLTTIQSDEATHSTVLQAQLKTLGETPITSCKFKFDSALTDVATMAATARVVENLGVMAYLGAASLVTDPQLLEAAGSILTVEARHQTLLNVISATGNVIPSAFDIALTPSEVLAMAAPFLDGPCDLGLPANPSLAVTNTGSVGQGTSLTFSSTAINSSVDTSTLFCQMMVGGQPVSISLPYNQCVVPTSVTGPVAIYVTSDIQPLQNNVVNRAGANSVLAGPAVTFIDASADMLVQMVRTGASGSNAGASAGSSSTQTISPEAASSVIAQGTSVASGSAAAAAATGTAAASSSNSASTDPSAGTRDEFTGLAPNGAINVSGWSNVPGA